MSWVTTPVPHTPSCRAQEHLHLYLSSIPTSTKQLQPFSTKFPYALSTSPVRPAHLVMLMTSSKGTNCDPNIKNRKCLRARHSDWLVPCFPTSDSGVNKKKMCLRPSFVEQYFRISTSARISDSVYNTLHGVHVPIRNSAPLCGRLLFPLST